MKPRNDNEGARPAEPGAIAWVVALVSLVLPWIGGALVLAGAFRFMGDRRYDVALVIAGLCLIVLDVVVDWWWAHPAVSVSSEPALNDRGAQLVGREFVVVEPIVNGRGKVRVGDTLWVCEGNSCPAGTRVRVAGARGAVLTVLPVSRGAELG